MSELIERTRQHVGSYKTLTKHRQDCLALCEEIERLTELLELPYPPNSGKTHWECCYKDRGHHNCAVKEVERLTADLKYYTDTYDKQKAANERLLAKVEQLEARIEELETKNGKLLTVFYSADAFMKCPTENYMESSSLAETLREAIDIASDIPDSFDDLVESGGYPEAQALKGAADK